MAESIWKLLACCLAVLLMGLENGSVPTRRKENTWCLIFRSKSLTFPSRIFSFRQHFLFLQRDQRLTRGFGSQRFTLVTLWLWIRRQPRHKKALVRNPSKQMDSQSSMTTWSYGPVPSTCTRISASSSQTVKYGRFCKEAAAVNSKKAQKSRNTQLLLLSVQMWSCHPIITSYFRLRRPNNLSDNSIDALPKCSLRVFMVSWSNDRFLEAANRHMGLIVFPTGVTHLNNSNSNWGQMNNAYLFIFFRGGTSFWEWASLQVFSFLHSFPGRLRGNRCTRRHRKRLNV